MSLDIAATHLDAAVTAIATSEAPLPERVQAAWTDHVQHVWEQPCLTVALLREFSALWKRYTAPSDDPRSTTVRSLTHAEAVHAITEVLALAKGVTVAIAKGDDQLATLADLREP